MNAQKERIFFYPIIGKEFIKVEPVIDKIKNMFKALSTLVLAILISGNAVNAQESKSEPQETEKTVFIEKHMKYLMADGGIWEAKNPNYKKDEQYSAKTYKYEMTKGVHGEQFRIKIFSNLNDVGWWTSWDGYYLWNPVKKQGVYHSLGSTGMIADGRLYFGDEDVLVNIFEIISYEGDRTVSKDVTIKINENEMHSTSYKLNEKGEWEPNMELIWKRLQKS